MFQTIRDANQKNLWKSENIIMNWKLLVDRYKNI
jgi:hypothetical protein